MSVHSFGLKSVMLSAASTLNRRSDHMALLLLGTLLDEVSYKAIFLPLVMCGRFFSF